MIKIKYLFSFLFTVLTSLLFAQHKNSDKSEIEKILASTKLEFMGSSMVLTQESKDALLKTVKSLNAFPNYRYRIIGYAPKKGDIILKQILSENRASQVKNILISKGIDASLLTTKGVVGIKAKKKQARKTRTPLSYIDFELIEQPLKKSIKEKGQAQSVSTTNLTRTKKLLTQNMKIKNQSDSQKNLKKP